MKAVISDFGGVLTTPLLGAFETLQRDLGLSLPLLGTAMRSAAKADGEHPLFELECGRISEAEFSERLSREIGREMGSTPDLSRFGEVFFQALAPNAPMIELMQELGERGHRMALLTNNVREWEPHWKSMAPVEEIFELIVDSAFVECRKPEPEIYELTLDRLSLDARDCLFIDDVEVNCEAGREIGMEVIHFRDNEQAEAEIRRALEA